MKPLVDTHVLLWTLNGSPNLSPATFAAFDDPANEVFVSAAALLEIAIKKATGKLAAPDDLLAYLTRMNWQVLDVTARHAWRVARLPVLSRDPFDRLIVGQALEENMVVLTADAMVRRYDAPVLRA